MSDIQVDNGLHATANVDTPGASAAGNAAHEGGLHADGTGASYAGSTGADASSSATPPELPDVGSVGDVDYAGQAGAVADATVADASAHADAALETAGSLGAPELPALPEVDGTLDGGVQVGADAMVDGTSAGFGAIVEGWLGAMGDLVVQLAGHVTGFVGF